MSNTFTEIDHKIISMVIFFPSAESSRVVVIYKQKYMHKILVNGIVKLAKEPIDDCPNMTIAVDLNVKHHTK